MINKTKILPGLSMLIAISACIIFAACSKMDGTYKEFMKGGEIRYSQKPDTIGVYPGHNRAEVWFAAKRKNISKFKIFWNNRADSVEVPVLGTSGTDTLSTVIDGLAEGSYTFEFFTFDRDGNPSIVIDTTGSVYGDEYISSLSNRLIRNSSLVNGNVRIGWYNMTNIEVVGTEILYKDQSGVEHTVIVPIDEDITRIDVRPLGNAIQYRTMFLPHVKAIDTFYTAYETVNLEIAQPVELDKGKFVEYALPTDAPLSRYAKGGMADLWDGTATNTTFYGTEAGSGNPHWFTFDMGVTAGLSKFIYFQRAVGVAAGEKLLFANANARVWEIWGSNDPNPDGSWDNSWVKLMDCESRRPSGKSYTVPVTVGDEDYIQARDGETFAFPENTPPMRYIRIKVLDTWDPSKNTQSFMGELTFFGVAE